MTIELSGTDRRDGKALALFAGHTTWQQGRTKDGRPFFAIPGSEAGLFHMVDGRDCSCADRQRSRNVCKHMRAVRLWLAAYQSGAVAPKPRPATPGVVDDTGTGDDRIILTPEGAAFLVEQTVSKITATAGYEALFPVCPCGDIADARDGLCDRCASEREHEQRMALKHEVVARGTVKEAWL